MGVKCNDMETYHLVDMNTLILLVHNHVIYNCITGLPSKNNYLRVFMEKHARRGVHGAYGPRVIIKVARASSSSNR